MKLGASTLISKQDSRYLHLNIAENCGNLSSFLNISKVILTITTPYRLTSKYMGNFDLWYKNRKLYTTRR